jgi:multiple sugar transport system permease protein
MKAPQNSLRQISPRGNLFLLRRRREKIGGGLAFAALVIIAAAVIFPIWWIFRSSLMTNAELYAWPPSLLPGRWRFSN